MKINKKGIENTLKKYVLVPTLVGTMIFGLAGCGASTEAISGDDGKNNSIQQEQILIPEKPENIIYDVGEQDFNVVVDTAGTVYRDPETKEAAGGIYDWNYLDFNKYNHEGYEIVDYGITVYAKHSASTTYYLYMRYKNNVPVELEPIYDEESNTWGYPHFGTAIELEKEDNIEKVK